MRAHTRARTQTVLSFSTNAELKPLKDHPSESFVTTESKYKPSKSHILMGVIFSVQGPTTTFHMFFSHCIVHTSGNLVIAPDESIQLS